MTCARFDPASVAAEFEGRDILPIRVVRIDNSDVIGPGNSAMVYFTPAGSGEPVAWKVSIGFAMPQNIVVKKLIEKYGNPDWNGQKVQRFFGTPYYWAWGMVEGMSAGKWSLRCKSPQHAYASLRDQPGNFVEVIVEDDMIAHKAVKDYFEQLAERAKKQKF
jgi:hypothetical protein